MSSILFLGPATSIHALRFVAFLRSRGHEVVHATAHVSLPGEWGPQVPLVTPLSAGPIGVPALLRAASRARGLVRASRPDLTLAYYLTSYGVIAALAGARPWVGATAGGDVLVDPFDTLPRRLRNWTILTGILPSADGMLAWAPHVADRLVDLGFPSDRIFVRSRGVDLERFPFREPVARGSGQPLRILSNRSLKPLYQVETLVRALALLAREGVAFEAVIAGDGPCRRALEVEARASGLEGRVRFAGQVDPGEVAAMLGWAHVYVSTSSTDGASSSLFEAMAVGAWPVVTDIAANRGVLEDGVSGRLFPVGDEAALAGRLVEAAADDDLRREGARRARAVAENRLDFRHNMAAIEEFLLGRIVA